MLHWRGILCVCMYLYMLTKGHAPSADLRCGGKDSISPSTLVLAAKKGLLGMNTLYITPNLPKQLALR